MEKRSPIEVGKAEVERHCFDLGRERERERARERDRMGGERDRTGLRER